MLGVAVVIAESLAVGWLENPKDVDVEQQQQQQQSHASWDKMVVINQHVLLLVRVHNLKLLQLPSKKTGKMGIQPLLGKGTIYLSYMILKWRPCGTSGVGCFSSIKVPYDCNADATDKEGEWSTKKQVR